MSKKKPKQKLNIEFQNLQNNPVAKFAHRVNRAEFFRDRTVYSRKGKHKDRESFCIRYFTIMNTKKFVENSLIHFTQRAYFGSGNKTKHIEVAQ